MPPARTARTSSRAPTSPAARGGSQRRARRRSVELGERDVHVLDQRFRVPLVIEILVVVALGVDVGIEAAVRLEEVRARDVLAVRRVLLADVGILVAIEPDHDELLRPLDNIVVVVVAAVALSVPAALGVEDKSYGNLLLLV